MALSINRIVNCAMSSFKQPIIALAVINVAVALVAFIKDIALAAFAGTSLQADALTLAYFLPDSIGNNMFAAAIAVVCVPVFSRLLALDNILRLRISIKQVSVRFLTISVLLLIIVYAYSEMITSWLASSNPELDLAILPLFRLLLPTIVLFVVVAIGTAVLQTLRSFFVPALAPLLFNFIFLGGVIYCFMLGLSVETGVHSIASAITLGVGLMALLIAVNWYKAISRIQISLNTNSTTSTNHSSEDWMDMMRIFIPYVVILFSIQAIYLAERFIITSFDSGTAAALSYAFRLTQFPVWVFVSAVSIVILPSLSKHLALGQRTEASLVMVNAFRGVVLIAIPSTIFLFLLREPLIMALFQRGAFDSHSVLLTSSIVEGYSLSVLSQSISLLCLRYFLAERQLFTVLSIFTFTAFITILLDFWLTHIMGPRGIGYGAAIGAFLNAILLLCMLWKNIRPTLKVIFLELRLYCIAILMALMYFPFSKIVWFWIPVHSNLTAIFFILLTGCLFLICYFFTLRRYWPSLFTALNINWGKG